MKLAAPPALVLGLLLGLGLVRSVGAAIEEPFCSGEVLQVGEPLYQGGSKGYSTTEEAARAGIRLLLTEDVAQAAPQAEWTRIPLDTLGSDQGSYTFGGEISTVVPQADRDNFVITVSKTAAGGYLFTGGAVCLTGK